jgi:fatty-acid peroxygenase
MPVTCIHGREGARLFYSDKLRREGAVPKPVQKTLFGERAVQTLDGRAHHRRKAAFMSLMTRDRVDALMREMHRQWQRAGARWGLGGSTVLFEAAREVLTRATCTWAGLRISDGEARERARDFTAMVDGFGGIALRQVKGRRARARTERWVERFVRERRAQGQAVDAAASAPSVLDVMSFHCDEDGELLDARLAAVEIINVVRPTIAVSWFVTFAALAMHEHPEWRARVADEGELDRFCNEVRRFYPFAPFLGARVREPFEWRGVELPAGRLVLFDVYGQNHDPAIWNDPEVFRPDRFRDYADDGFGFIPQGGGDARLGHRCAGEWITQDALKVAVRFLASEVQYDVPSQDLSYPLSRMPTLPRSGFVFEHIERVSMAAE